MIYYIIFLVSFIFSNQFNNMPIDLKQPDGSILSCFISGDEYYQRLHDDNNYTIVQSQKDGYYYFASLSNNDIIPSFFKVNQINPSNLGLIPNHLKNRWHQLSQ